jgi:glycosyltransferase involved in cell wall biosynthesis
MSEIKYRISVIIPLFNGSKSIKSCLDSLENSNYDKNRFEIIIVDDHSTDDSVSIVEQYSEQSAMNIKGFAFEENAGPATVRNYAIRMAEGEIYAFTDPDCIVDLNWLNNIDAYVAEGNGLIGGEIIANEPVIFPWKLAPVGQERIASNLAIHRDILGLERFNEKFKFPIGEDADLSYRLEKGDVVYSHETNLVVTHPVETLSLPELISKGLHRESEVLLYKLNPQLAISRMNPILKPIGKAGFSPLFYIGATFALASFIILLSLKLTGLIVLGLILVVATLGLIFSQMFDFFVIYRPDESTKISISDRIRTILYCYIYVPVILWARIKGTLKYKKILL